MSEVNPFQIPIPTQFINDPQVRAYQEQLQVIIRQLRDRTGGDDDSLEDLQAKVDLLEIALNENIDNTDTNTGNISTINESLVIIEDKVDEVYNNRVQHTILVNQSTIEDVLADGIDSTKAYQIDGVVNMDGLGGFQIPVGGVSIFSDSSTTSKITCSDDDFTLFETVSGGGGDVSIRGATITVSGSNSKVYDLTSSTGLSGVQFNNVNYINCTSLGIINGYRQGVESNTLRLGGTPSLTLDGVWLGGYSIETSLVVDLVDGSYSLFSAGATFQMNSRFKTNQNVTLQANVSFVDFSDVNFINPSTFQINGAIVNRNGVVNPLDTNITPNILASNLVCDFENNTGVENTFVGGRLNIDTEVETVIAASSTFYDLLGTYSSSELQHFDSPANGQLRNVGQSPVDYKVFASLSIDGSQGDDITIAVVIYRDSTGLFENAYEKTRVINQSPGSRDIAYFTISTNVILNQNDYIKLQVANASGNGNVTAELDSYFYAEAR